MNDTQPNSTDVLLVGGPRSGDMVMCHARTVEKKEPIAVPAAPSADALPGLARYKHKEAAEDGRYYVPEYKAK